MKKNFKLAELDPKAKYQVSMMDNDGIFELKVMTGEALKHFINGIGHCYTTINARKYTQDDENRDTCKRIAEEIEAYADGNVYRCPECNELVTIPNHVGDKFKCPCCDSVRDIEDFEQCGIWDYMEDVLDIEYTVSRDRSYRSCKICVACGGPNIYINTADASVKLYWWSDRAEYPISYSARDAIDEWAEEYWEM